MHPATAASYGPYLEKWGFYQVAAKGYTPEIGDVAVFGANKWHKSGHVEGYDGEGWVSDFEQRNISANGRRPAGSMKIYRSGCKCNN